MSDFADLKEDVAEAAINASRNISNFVKRQYRLRLTNSCRVCNNFNLRGHDKTFPIGRLDLDYEDVRSTAQSGCPYCALMVTFIDQLPPGVARGRQVMLEYHDNAFFEMSFAYNESVKFEIFLPPGVQIPSWPQLRNSGTIAPHAGRRECFEFIRRKIRDCENHPECNGTSYSLLPHRVLDVGPPGDKTVKIVENCKDEGQRYIALSYCWGGHLPLRSTTSNISEMKKGIAWNELPRVFSDVVYVAWMLGVQYVWIDSLCILQDDKDDWEIEASKMAEYYSQAHLVVACSTSANPTVPFLARRDPYWLPLNFKFKDKAGASHDLKIQRVRRLRYMTYTALDHNRDKVHEHDFGLLSKRAWVWQENALATRIVHYTSHGLVFECKGDIGVYTEEMPDTPLPLDWIQSLPHSFAEHSDDSYKQWHELVKTYSSRDLTFHADKLPAIGGAAAAMRKILDSDYLAGLWRKNLFNDLLWHADTWGIEKTGAFTQPPPTPLDNGSPSWSWASLNGRLSYQFADEPCSTTRVFATVRDLQVETSKHSEFGQCRGGYIVLSAPALRANLSSTIPSGYYNYHLYHVESRQTIPESIADTILEVAYPEGESEGPGTIRRAGPNSDGYYGGIQGEILCVVLQQRGDTIFTLLLARSHIDPTSFVRIGYSRVDHAKLDVSRVSVMENIVIR
ncbi:heterokaryon incompatibility protein-domain-containing protein [Nemania sp. NC0429]|nr:heterokaryon incompatibility protein-domain-containing protein [Nemania sp. NC0429]